MLKKSILTGVVVFQAVLAGTVASAAEFNVSNGQQFRDALAQAADNDQDDVINMAEGVYAPEGNIFEYLADATANSEENFKLTIQGAGADSTVFDGGDASAILFLSSFLLANDANVRFEVRDVAFQNGYVGDWDGAGLAALTRSGSILVERVKFFDNEVTADDWWGGGLDAYSETGAITLSRSYFSGNRAGHGGGASLTSLGGEILAVNNIFEGNTANGDGGGLQIGHVDPDGQNIAVVNNTFFNNAGGEGGGALVFGSGNLVANVYNNIFQANQAPAGDDLFYYDEVGGGLLSFTMNVYSNLVGPVADNCGDGSCQTRINRGESIGGDALFADPSNDNFELLQNSPAVDAGSVSAPGLPAEDYEGNPRQFGTGPDMGALESEFSLSVSEPNPEIGGGGCALAPVGAASSGMAWWTAILASLLGLRFRRR
ncbi:MAG: hypothetical protein IT573_08885 [Deltaproteobacteria bacterium]|nr:hypothetical protein [Deltaproteobacteria bacterium]